MKETKHTQENEICDGKQITIRTTKWHHYSFSYAVKRVHEIFLKSKLQIMKLKTSTSILGFKNYFLTYSALQTLVPPNLCLLLCLSRILNIFNVSFSSSLDRLNTLSPCQKFVQIGNAQNMDSSFIWQSFVVEIKTAPQYNW